MRKITFFACMMVAIIASAQFSEPGFYRVHNVLSDDYICIRGTHYERSTNPDAFWPCIKMLSDSDQIADPGSIIYIPEMGQTSLCAQGVSTYLLTGLMLEILPAQVMEGGLPTYIAKTQYNNFPCIFRDYGNGLTAGTIEGPESHWWIEPVNEGSMDTSFLGVKPINEAVCDTDGWYWATMCCDFPFVLPVDGGVEGAYTVNEVKMGYDSLYYAAPVQLCGQGDTVPAATPVLLKCKSAYASGNKIIPVASIANRMAMPIVNDLLMGNYFSVFNNHCSFTDLTVTKDYYPAQATKASDDNLALGVDAEGRLGFYPMPEGSYMAANTAWLSMKTLELEGVTAVYLGEVPVQEPDPIVIAKGDINGDNTINITDVGRLISFVISDPSSEEKVSEDNSDDDPDGAFIIEAADVNGDGLVNITDVGRLISILLDNAGVEQ